MVSTGSSRTVSETIVSLSESLSWTTSAEVSRIGSVEGGTTTPGRFDAVSPDPTPSARTVTARDSEVFEGMKGTPPREAEYVLWTVSAVVSKVSVLLLARIDDISVAEATEYSGGKPSESELEEDDGLARRSEVDEMERSQIYMSAMLLG